MLALLLAAGSGRRMGFPKALMRDETGRSWLVKAIDVLCAGGCSEVVVVLGASAERAVGILEAECEDRVPVRWLIASDWASGMGASLAAGLCNLNKGAEPAALIHLVDLPDVSPEVVRRILDRVTINNSTLARASYSGQPGHPVVLGRDHWAEIMTTASGDQGARAYLATQDVEGVECGDLASGHDVDHL